MDEFHFKLNRIDLEPHKIHHQLGSDEGVRIFVTTPDKIHKNFITATFEDLHDLRDIIDMILIRKNVEKSYAANNVDA